MAGKPGAEARMCFDDLAEELAGIGASRSRMFGSECLKAGPKMFACLVGDAVVVKLPQPEHAAALALPGAELFDPSGRGRPMKEWVSVPVEHAAQWRDFAEAAAAYVRG